jgi:gas vesicle protein
MKKVLGMVAAAAAGYVAGVLMAPKKGEETRQDLKVKSEKAKKVAGEKVEQAKRVWN